MEVCSKIKVVEIDGVQTEVGKRPEILVESHDRDSTNYVVLVVGGVRYTVVGSQLIGAAQRAELTFSER